MIKRIISKRYDIVLLRVVFASFFLMMGFALITNGKILSSIICFALGIWNINNLQGQTVFKSGCFSVKKRGNYYEIAQFPFVLKDRCAIAAMNKAGKQISDYIINTPGTIYHCKTHSKIVDKLKKIPNIDTHIAKANSRSLLIEKIMLRMHVQCLKCRKKHDCLAGNLFKSAKVKENSTKVQFYHIDMTSKNPVLKNKASAKQLFINIFPVLAVFLTFYGVVCYKWFGYGGIIAGLVGLILSVLYWYLLDAVFHEFGHYIAAKFCCLINKKKSKVWVHLKNGKAITKFKSLDVYTDNQIRIISAAGSVVGMFANIMVTYLITCLIANEWGVPLIFAAKLTFVIALAYTSILLAMAIASWEHNDEEMNDVTAMKNPRLYRQLYADYQQTYEFRCGDAKAENCFNN